MQSALEYAQVVCTPEFQACPRHRGRIRLCRLSNARGLYTTPQPCLPMHLLHQENQELCLTNDQSLIICRRIVRALVPRRVQSERLLLLRQLHMGATPCGRLPMCRHTCQPNVQEYQTVHVGRIRQRTERSARLVRDALVRLLATTEQLLA